MESQKRKVRSKRPNRATLAEIQEARPHAISVRDLASLGGGEVAYIKIMTTAEAEAMFPAIEGLPKGISLYAVHAADGTPLALTDSMSAAIGHARGDELEIASLH